MAPIKLEDHIREQFEEREVAPSAGAWDKLETKLEKEHSKKRPLYIWYGIAASIVGILFISSQFFLNEETQKTQELVEIEVEQPQIDTINTSEIVKTETQLTEEGVAQEFINKESLGKEIANDKVKAEERSVKPIIKTKRSIITTETNTRVAVQETVQSTTENISEAINKDVIINAKVDEVVAAVQKIKQERNAVSMAEIDALLLNAQREIATERVLNETKIDAMALLGDVEYELEKSLRDKVFYALGDSFSIIKTAIVERNY